MVLEQLLPPALVEKKPLDAFPLGLGLALLGIILGVLFFRIDAAIMGIVLVTIASVPFLSKILDIEAERKQKVTQLIDLISRNKRIITIYLVFFFGVATGYFLIYLFFPGSVMQSVFDEQRSIFAVSDLPSNGTSDFNWLFFNSVLRNNIGVILLCVLLSFLYGSGAILVLTWNASVLGIFLASFSNLNMISIVAPFIFFEFMAYFLAAVSGGLISIAVNKHRFNSRNFKIIIADVVILLLVALMFIVSAAFIETAAISFV